MYSFRSLINEHDRLFFLRKKSTSFALIWEHSIDKKHQILPTHWLNLKKKSSLLVYSIPLVSHCLGLDLNGLFTRRNFWRIPGILGNYIQEIPAFRDFTIRDPRHFVILFEAKFHDFEEKNPKKKFFFSEFFFSDFLAFFLFLILFYSFLFIHSDCQW